MDHGVHDTTAVKSQRPRWWQDARWIISGVIAVTVVFLLWGLFGPEAAIRVSPETTFITEPLAADGLPDYRAALLAMAGPAPPPEENAAAALLQLCWPLGIEEADLPKVCAALGVPNEPPGDPLCPPDKDAGFKISDAMYDAATEQPWTGGDLPEVEAWLITNEAKIDRLAAASRLSVYWLPTWAFHRTGGSIWESWVESWEPLYDFESRRANQILMCRANWHIGKGRWGDAWRDLHAASRLGAMLIAPERGPQFLVTRLVAHAIQSSADKALTKCLLCEPAVPRDVLAEIRQDLEARRPPSAMGDTALAERIFVMDMLVFAGRRAPGGRRERIEIFGDIFPPDTSRLLHASLDWNSLLHQVNTDYDRIDAALQLGTHRERLAAFERLDESHNEEIREWDQWPGRLMTILSRGYRTRRVGASIQSNTFGAAIWAAPLARSQALLEMTRTAAALAAWRIDHEGEASLYPEQLGDLVPTYLSAIPIDPFTDKPFIYERRGEGYLLASVGMNGVYDDGTDEDGWIVKGKWQTEEQDVPNDRSDMVVRMPVPKR